MSRLSFQTQLASIMEVLANAAVAEICRLVEDDYGLVTLQVSQVQRENKALKRKLHLLELRMARGTAERRLRESQGHRGGLRVSVSGGERRDMSPLTDSSLEQSSLWPLRSLSAAEPPRSKSPDVEFVEPQPLDVKEETKVETKEEEVHLIEDNVVMDTTPHLPDLPQHGLEILSPAPAAHHRSHSATNRRVEEEDEDIVLVKVEEPEEMKNKTRKSPALSIQEGVVESSTDDFRSALVEASQLAASSFSEVSLGWSNVPFPQEAPGPSSGLYVSNDPLSDLQISNVLSGSLADLVPDLAPGLSALPKKKRAKTIRKKNCACDFCDKRFSSPANLESHLRTHTGEKPFACSVCGKLFSQFWNMKIHKNIHTGARPYACSVCSERFSDPSNLKKHERRHFNHPRNPNCNPNNNPKNNPKNNTKQ